jgi:hypothetical protein
MVKGTRASWTLNWRGIQMFSGSMHKSCRCVKWPLYVHSRLTWCWSIRRRLNEECFQYPHINAVFSAYRCQKSIWRTSYIIRCKLLVIHLLGVCPADKNPVEFQHLNHAWIWSLFLEADGSAERQAPAEKYPVFRALGFRFTFALVNALSYSIICVVCSFEGVLFWSRCFKFWEDCVFTSDCWLVWGKVTRKMTSEAKSTGTLGKKLAYDRSKLSEYSGTWWR